MKKLFTLLVVALFATSIFAGQTVYFKLSANTSWWSNDGAKIGALCKVSTDPNSYGVYADFFTLVPGTTDTYRGEIPFNEEPITAIQFLRYNSVITSPDQDDPNKWWNATGIMSLEEGKDMFTATGNSDTWDSTVGTWGVYSSQEGGSEGGSTTPSDNAFYFQLTEATKWWPSDGCKIGALFKVDNTPTSYGIYVDFFTLVPGTTDLYVGYMPDNEEPLTAVQFLRYKAEATSPQQEAWWNATGIMSIPEGKNKFTAESYTDGVWDSTTGTWGVYNPTSAEETQAEAASKVQKIMIDGQIYILYNGQYYNLLGVPVK